MDSNNPDIPSLPFAGLRCPHCDYDLTGLPQARCPECGNEFDPILLEQIRDDVERPATPWDTHRNIRGFVHTWTMAMRIPRRLARDFPSRYSVLHAWAYSGLCYGIAALLLLACSLVGGFRSIAFVSAIGLGSVIACILAEILIASWLALLLEPTFARKNYRFWRGLTHYTSGFTVTSAIAGCVPTIGLSLELMNGSQGDFFVATFWSLATVSFFWWITSLGTMIAERSRRGFRLTSAYVGITVIGLIGIVIGFLTTALAVAVLGALFPIL
ncbi:MAG: hypothetical protein ACE5EQ_03565 [Phycisphaerae bacterium]